MSEASKSAPPAKKRAHRARHVEPAPAPSPVISATGDDEDLEPGWWTPYAVLGALVLIGILGLFGAFNKPLGFLAPGHTPHTPNAADEPGSPAAAPAAPAAPAADDHAGHNH